MTSSNECMAIVSLVILSYFSLVPLLHCEGSPSGTNSNTNTASTFITVDLIHRDSPNSPLYNSSQTSIERLHNSIQRSFARAASNHHNFLKSSYSRISTSSVFSAVSPVPLNMNNTINVTSTVFPDDNEYLMKLAIGTPPHELFAVADTGSDLIWIQCKPCNVCYKQKSPIFNPVNSSTYKDLSCSSQPCQSLNLTGGRRPCEGDHSRCPYFYGYLDDSSTAGYLANETFTLDSTNGTPIAFPQVSFGCGHQNKGFHDENWSGVVGLGRGSLSLINQLEPSISRRFSYCLIPQYSNSSDTSGSSKLHLGNFAAGEVTVEGVVSTPMIVMPGFDSSFYFISIEGISIGVNRIDYPSLSSSYLVGGKMIIDSGTTLTMLPRGFFGSIKQELRRQIDATPVWPPSQELKLCYNANEEWKIPNITVHFTGADIELPPMNTFIPIPSLNGEVILCFAFVPQDDEVSPPIYGNIAQMDFLVEYDLVNSNIKFRKTNCMNHV